MTHFAARRLLRPESLTAAATMLAAALFLIPAFKLPPLSALLPIAMLIGLIALALMMLVIDQRRASQGEPATKVTQAPWRVLSAFAMIALFCCAVDAIGFYVSTTITVPLIAYMFGYRNLPHLALATVVVIGGIYLIFGFAMQADFPTGLLGLM